MIEAYRSEPAEPAILLSRASAAAPPPRRSTRVGTFRGAVSAFAADPHAEHRKRPPDGGPAEGVWAAVRDVGAPHARLTPDTTTRRCRTSLRASAAAGSSDSPTWCREEVANTIRGMSEQGIALMTRTRETRRHIHDAEGGRPRDSVDPPSLLPETLALRRRATERALLGSRHLLHGTLAATRRRPVAMWFGVD
jgi:hypothetical protein